MTSRRWAMLVGAVAMTLPACRLAEGEGPGAPNVPKFVGAASCSAASCHGGIDPRPGADVRQDEYTRWVRHDRHATAYATLFNEKSKAIMRRLGEPGQPETPAHTHRRCLACHTSGGEERPDLRHDGVGCEACHGPASLWLADHTARASWRGLPADRRMELGMTPVDDPAALARACAGCHVGSPPDRDVDHDLIAAGHPRMAFDFATFLLNTPPHWNVETRDKTRSPAFEARAWAVGAAISAEFAFELLAHRAGDARRWPEFSEYGCFACHQQLRPSTRSRGTPPWGTWGFATLAAVAEEVKFGLAPIDAVRALMEHPHPDRAKVAPAATAGARTMRGLTTAAGKIAFTDPSTLRRMQDRVLSSEPGNWDEAAQVYFAAVALTEARIRQEKWRPEDATQARDALRAMHGRLAFPQGQESPPTFRGGVTFGDLLRQLRR